MKNESMFSEIQSIRNLMERSVKFLSLSGLSGVLAGGYALIGACFASNLLQNGRGVSDTLTLMVLAIVVLVLAVGTAFILSKRKARVAGQHIWNQASKALFQSMFPPLLVGGLVSLIALWYGYYHLIMPALLVFYGLSLVAGGQFTFSMIKGLGWLLILTGLIAFVFPGHDLLFWSIGFGFFHILYGSLIFFKHERKRG